MVSPLKAMAVVLLAQGVRQVDGLRVHLFQAAAIFLFKQARYKKFPGEIFDDALRRPRRGDCHGW